MTYKIGTVGEFMAWTEQVIRDPAIAEGAPKHWFDSEEPALQASTGGVSGGSTGETAIAGESGRSSDHQSGKIGVSATTY